jgi:hypothetical protein
MKKAEKKKNEQKEKQEKKPKFEMTQSPTKVKYQGVPVKKINIKPLNKNTPINDANAFIDTTMKNIFKQYKPTEDSRKMWRVIYKLSDGRWYSSKFFSSPTDSFYPDFTNSAGGSKGVNIDKETVEFMNINIITAKEKK